MDRLEELKPLKQWICYNAVPKLDKEGNQRYKADGSQWISKKPMSTLGNYGAGVDEKYREHWGTYDEAVNAVEKYGYTGVGFVFTGTPYYGVDIDHCINTETGEINPAALDIIKWLDTYTEYSRSGTGFHMIAGGSIPQGERSTPDGAVVDAEMYETGRFFVVTGDIYQDKPIKPHNEASAYVVHDLYFKRKEKPRTKQPTEVVNVPGGDDRRMLDAAVEFVDVSKLSYEEWIRFGAALKFSGYGYEVFDRKSADDVGRYSGERETAEKWRSFTDKADAAGAIMGIAMDQGFEPKTAYSDEERREYGRQKYREEQAIQGTQQPHTEVVYDKDKKAFVPAEKPSFKPITPVSAADLDGMELPPITWLVDGMLPTGLALIGAPPKSFKSYMGLDLCIQICTGGYFLGFKTEKHDCLYFDLESTKRRPKSRLTQILGNAPKPSNLRIITADDNPGRLGKGFEEQLSYQLEQFPDTKLVVIDVFTKIRMEQTRKQSEYERDYADAAQLLAIANKYNVCLLLVHHSRKMRDPGDVFNELSGSTGLTGSMDVIWMISKEKRTDEEATLHITGRDVPPRELKIRFNHNSFRWECLGDAEQIEQQRQQEKYFNSKITRTIVKLVKDHNGSWEGTAQEIQEASRYLTDENGRIGGIFENPTHIGRFINEYIDNFRFFHRIEVGLSRGKTRKYVFSDVSDVSVFSDVSDVSDGNKQ